MGVRGQARMRTRRRGMDERLTVQVQMGMVAPSMVVVERDDLRLCEEGQESRKDRENKKP